MKSIVNHFYWSVMSTQIDNKDLVEAKWKSVLNHTQNIHDGHGDLFPVCSHPKLSKLDERATKWLKPDSEVTDGLQKIVENKSLLKDIRNASPHGQTSGVEGYHSVVNHCYVAMTIILMMPEMHFLAFSSTAQKIKRCMSTRDRSKVVCMGN